MIKLLISRFKNAPGTPMDKSVEKTVFRTFVAPKLSHLVKIN